MLAPIEEQVPPKKYGGTELVVYNLVEGLIRKGHDVTLFASGDSTTSAKLVSFFDKAIRTDPRFENDQRINDSCKQISLGKSIDYINKEGNFEIVHNHITWRPLPFVNLIKSKFVSTMHGPMTFEYDKIVYQTFRHIPYVSISDNQRKPLPELNWAATVYNGIDVSKFDYSYEKGKYLAFLGRFSPEKAPHLAIKVAKKLGIPLKMGAKIDLLNKDFHKYYKEKIEPEIDGKLIQYLGELGHKEKNDLLKNALATLIPIQWEEPFGLVMPESNACGTPVVAFRRGSVPELIKDDVNGFVIEDGDVDGMVEAVKKCPSLDRKAVRQVVIDNFSKEKMVEGYEKVYKNILSQK